MPQLKAAIAELQAQGFDLPDYPDDPQTDAEKATAAPATTRSRAAP
jgi:isocitrate dehydrogenase